MNKTYLFYAVIVAAVVIGYFFIGELAFGALALALFGGDNKEKAKAAKAAADEHGEIADIKLAESIKHENAAKDSHDEALEAAETKTDPKYHTPAGFKRRHSSSK